MLKLRPQQEMAERPVRTACPLPDRPRPRPHATRPSLTSFDGVKTGEESAKFERPTDLDALSRKWGINTGCESGVVALSGGGEVAVVGGRSGSFSLRAGYEGRRGAMRDSGLRSAKGRKLYSRW